MIVETKKAFNPIRILEIVGAIIGSLILIYVGYNIFTGLKSIFSIPSLISDKFNSIVKAGQTPPNTTQQNNSGWLVNPNTYYPQSSGPPSSGSGPGPVPYQDQPRNAFDGFLHGLFPNWFQ